MHSESDTLSVIPLPVDIEKRAGEFVISPDTTIIADADNHRNATYLHNLIAPPTGFTLPIRAGKPEQATSIRLKTGGDRKALGREGYSHSPSLCICTGRNLDASKGWDDCDLYSGGEI